MTRLGNCRRSDSQLLRRRDDAVEAGGLASTRELSTGAAWNGYADFSNARSSRLVSAVPPPEEAAVCGRSALGGSTAGSLQHLGPARGMHGHHPDAELVGGDRAGYLMGMS
jgi:hypothetical protein